MALEGSKRQHYKCNWEFCEFNQEPRGLFYLTLLKSHKNVFVISWTYKRITCIWFKTSALLPLLGVLEPTILLLVHWKNFLGNGCLLLFVCLFVAVDRLLSHFLSRWASHWLTRELNKVTLKWSRRPTDSDSRATMWFLWVKKTTVSTNWHQFEPIFGCLREEGAEALKFTSLASSDDSAWFWLSTICVVGQAVDFSIDF